MWRSWECFGGEPVKPSTSHAQLGDAFFDKVRPAKFPEHILRYRNQRAAAAVGLDTLTDDEFKQGLKRLANDKAAGPDGLPGECFKYLPENGKKALRKLFDHCLHTQTTPQAWRCAAVGIGSESVRGWALAGAREKPWRGRLILTLT